MKAVYRSLFIGGIGTLCLLLAGCGAIQQDVERVPASRDTLRVMAYNIHHGEGMDGIVDLDRIARIINIYSPDVVALQEIDSSVVRTNEVDQLGVLARKTGMSPHFSSFMPYQGGKYGMGILSSLPVTDESTYRLPDGTEPRTSIGVSVVLQRTSIPVHIVGVHFYRTEDERLAQARSLLAYLTEYDGPVVLAGDFNSLPGGVVMSELGKQWHIIDKGADSYTFPSYAPAREIDYILLRPPGSMHVVNEFLVHDGVASDHSIVVVDLAVSNR